MHYRAYYQRLPLQRPSPISKPWEPAQMSRATRKHPRQSHSTSSSRHNPQHPPRQLLPRVLLELPSKHPRSLQRNHQPGSDEDEPSLLAEKVEDGERLEGRRSCSRCRAALALAIICDGHTVPGAAVQPGRHRVLRQVKSLSRTLPDIPLTGTPPYGLQPPQST